MTFTRESIRTIERNSIRSFVMGAHLTGRVLDFGAGEMPYRDLVEGEYVPFQKGDPIPSADAFDAVLCTQVIQYVEQPRILLRLFKLFLKTGGRLVMTFPTTWEECEPDDYWRFTEAGMRKLLNEVGFTSISSELRWSIPYEDFKLSGGYGVIATR